MVAVQFSVLGPLTMTRDGVRRPVSGGKIGILLASLLLCPNQVVSFPQLAERLWDRHPPRNARRVLQTTMVRLRQSLDLGEVIVTEPGGYRASLEPGQLDLLEFRRLMRLAADAPSAARESRLLHEALALWRGPACADVESEALHQIDVPPLTEQRLHGLERRIDLDIHLGEDAALVAELRALVAEHPLRERLWGQFMTVLYRAGRQADALDAYRTVTQLLKEELGIDPSAELHRLHQAILAQEPLPASRPPARPRGDVAPAREVPSEGEQPLGTLLRIWRERALLTQEQLAAKAALNVRTVRRLESGVLRRPRSTSVRQLAEALGLDDAELALLTGTAHGGQSVSRPAGTMPRQLPTDVSAFVGREAELAVLDHVGDADTVLITAIDGMAGVGKTTLAVHAAHELAPHFPDGNLFVDLHGFTSGVAPADPSDTLARVLAVLGIPGESIPGHLDDRAALYRSVLAGKKLLIVLDNAADEAQIQPLLPGAGGCLVLITSRRRLVGLDGARTVTVDVLPIGDAVALFTATAGRERLAGAPEEELAEVVRRCGLLPLAIRLAAARLKAHPAWDVRDLLERLREGQRRLSELQAGQRSVTAALDLSYRTLTDAERRAYRLLGLHAGPDITPDAAAALLDVPVTRASALLDRLLERHLLQERVPARYRFHDLIKAHACEEAAAEEPAAERRAALGRLLDHYIGAASAAMDRLYPYEADTRPRLSASTVPAPAMPDAAVWLEAELPNLLALPPHAAEHGFADHVRHLSATLHRCLRTRGSYSEAMTLLECALSAARAAADHPGEMEALLGLGELHHAKSRHDLAVEDATRALAIARAVGHRSGELRALNVLGTIHLSLDRFGPALDHFGQALELARTNRHRTGELEALIGSSNVCRLMGQYERGLENLTQALGIARMIGHHTSELRALLGLGYIHLRKGELGSAAGYLDQVLSLSRSTGHRSGELSSLNALAHLHHLQGRREQAREHFRRVLALARAIGNRNFQFEAVYGIGRLHLDSGDHHQARDNLRQALDLASDLDHPSDQVRAHDGLAHAYAALGRSDRAGHHWDQALDILTSLGIERTDEGGIDVESIRAHRRRLAHPVP
ncbi:BTAD domain-containing putative transcriptional regulator [Nonomuraea sp. NPDC048826]|uniref:AfsR/SARP family transcriptional regulator n=1 Tax=Nonomuraea sp. NPDC048826 TaxID=3364347 RepID=UPI0037173D7A